MQGSYQMRAGGGPHHASTVTITTTNTFATTTTLFLNITHSLITEIKRN